MGHIHIYSAVPGAQRRFWTEVAGAEQKHTSMFDAYAIPGALIVISKSATPRAGTEGSVVGHIGIKVRDLPGAAAKAEAAGLHVHVTSNTQRMVTGPDGVLVELTADPALPTPSAFHHIHFYVMHVDEVRNWYDDMFGAVPGRRGQFSAGDLPGVNLTFARSDIPLAPTAGRALDHIGFEVTDLQNEMLRLSHFGEVKIVRPFQQVPALGISVAFLQDPWGTTVELTDGLYNLK